MRISHSVVRESALILFGIALVAALLLLSPRDAFVSSEVRFTDASTAGLAIVPASCPSSPHYGTDHGSGPQWAYCICSGIFGIGGPLQATPDGEGYVIGPKVYDRQVYSTKHGQSFCIENEGDSTYFLPAKTVTELDSFRAGVDNVEGVHIWNFTNLTGGSPGDSGW